MVSVTEAAEIKLCIETLDCLIKLKPESSNNADFYNKIEELESKIVDNISKKLNMN